MLSSLLGYGGRYWSEDWQINSPPCFVQPIVSCYSKSWNSCCMVNQLKCLFIRASRDIGIKRFIKFCLVGLSGCGVQFSVYWLLTRVAGINGHVALILSTEASILSNFILNDKWTFRDKKTGFILTRLGKFHMVSLGVILIYLVTYAVLHSLLGLYDLVTLAIAIGAGVIWNFTINVFWTWRRSEVQQESFQRGFSK